MDSLGSQVAGPFRPRFDRGTISSDSARVSELYEEQDMPKEKSVVVFSASKDRGIAVQVQVRLGSLGVPSTVWDQGAIPPGGILLRDIQVAIDNASAAVLVMSADHEVEFDDRIVGVPRDNLVFECGLAVGMLGLTRTFVLKPRPRRGEPELHLPSDIGGAVWLEYAPAPSKDFIPSIAECAAAIEQRLGELYGDDKRMDWTGFDRAIDKLVEFAWVKGSGAGGFVPDAVVAINPGGALVASAFYQRRRFKYLFHVSPRFEDHDRIRTALAGLTELPRPIHILVVNDSVKTGESLATVLEALREQFDDSQAKIKSVAILDVRPPDQRKTGASVEVLERGYTAFPWGSA